jgi:hypothetical protein
MVDETAQTIGDVAKQLKQVQDRIILEDRYGRRWMVTSVDAIGTQTDDPGLIMKVERDR